MTKEWQAPETLKIQCKECEKETNHKVLVAHRIDEYNGQKEPGGEILTFYTLQCRGCDHYSFLQRTYSPEDIQPDETIPYTDWQYPEKENFNLYYSFLSDGEHNHLPRMLYDLYEELKYALYYECDTLGGVGLRMVVEAVCLHKKIPGRNLQKKIDSLFDKGYISKIELEVLHGLRDVGNVSAHKIKAPSPTLLEASLEAINHLLRAVYIFQAKTKKLRNRQTPKS